MNEANHRKTGDEGELIAISYLQSHDYEIIETNYTVQGGEIDIIAKREDQHIFFEVKYRTSGFFGSPEESLTRAKKRTLFFAIKQYCSRRWVDLDSVRFDFIGIERTDKSHRVTHYRNVGLQ